MISPIAKPDLEAFNERLRPGCQVAEAETIVYRKGTGSELFPNSAHSIRLKALIWILFLHGPCGVTCKRLVSGLARHSAQ